MTIPALEWRAMSQEDRDLGLNNGLAVSGSVDMVAGWEQRSADLRKRYPDHIDLGYGPRERNRIDFLKGREGGPTLLFIHGGYWQARAKEVFTVMSEGPMAHGINVALIGYTLAPDATLDEIVAEIHAGIDFLVKQLPNRRRVRRHRGIRLSAGAISRRWRCRTAGQGGWRYPASTISSRSVTAISTKLRLDEAMSRRNSPMIEAAGPLKPLSLVVGSAELPLLRKQTADFAAHRARYGLPVTYEEIPGADHFTILNEMMSPKGRITTLIRQLFERTAG
jgi:acetyl esterase/lipase